MKTIAVIDLGTNTCTLLIAKLLDNNQFETVCERRIGVKMGSGGIHKNILQPDAIDRGIAALKNHAQTIASYGVSEVRIIGTSAIRGAKNGKKFVQLVENELDWTIEVIDGEREADLIFKGVIRSISLIDKYFLILDIGGGSNEFILAKGKEPIWKKSFNIGVALTLEHFAIADPPTLLDCQQLENWYENELADLFDVCKIYTPQILIGCSGAFDTFMDILEQKEPDATIRKSSELPLDKFHIIHNRLIELSAAERCEIVGMDKNRVEMVVVAAIFTNYIIKKLKIEKIIHTHSSLKEGVLIEIIDSK